MKKIYVLFLLAISSIAIISCSESPEKYNKRALAVSDSIMSSLHVNMGFVEDCQEMWRSVVFNSEYISPTFREKKYCSDINTALGYFKEDMDKIAAVQPLAKWKNDAKELFNSISEPPEESKALYENVKELYAVYLKSFDLYEKPSGSLMSYTNQCSAILDKISDLKTKISIDRK